MIRCAAAILFLVPLNALPQDDPMETRVYNIEFLVRGIQDYPGGRNQLGFEDVTPIITTIDDAGPSFLSGEQLVDLIRSNIGEDSWDSASAGIEIGAGVLTVTNVKSVHEKIGQYLAYLRGLSGRMVVVDASYLLVDPAALARIRASGPAGRPAALTPAQAKQLLDAAREGREAELLKSMRMTAHSGQRVSLEDARQVAYVRDHDIQIAIGVPMADPVFGQLATGTSLDVRAMIEPFDGGLTLEIRADVATLESMDTKKLRLDMKQVVGGGDPDAPNPGARLAGGATEVRIDLPRVNVDRIRTTVTLRDRETALVGGVQHGNRILVFLLTPSTIQAEEKPAAEPAFEETRILRVYDISPMTRSTQDFSGPSLDQSLAIQAGGAVTGATFTLEESAGVRIEPDSMMDLIRSRIAPSSWENRRNQIVYTDGRLFVRQKPEVLKEIDAYLKSVLSSRAVMITTEAVLVGFRKDARSAWERDIPALGAGGYFVDAAPAEKLLAEAAKGALVRVVERAEVTGYPQERVHVLRMRQEAYIADLEPQVTTYAGAYDPVVSTLRSGFVFDVRPFFISGTDRISVELNSSYAQAEIETIGDAVTGASVAQLPRLSGQRWTNNVVCAQERWTVAAVGSRKTGEENEDLVLMVRARANPIR